MNSTLTKREPGPLLISLLLVSLIGLGAWGGDTSAATCTSTGTGNWSAAATWSCVGLPAATVPGVADAVIIDNRNPAHTVTVNVNSAALSVTFTGGNKSSTLQLSPAITLNVAGAVTIDPPTGGGTKALNVGAGTLNAASIIINGGAAAGNPSQLTVSTGTITTTGSITFSGTASDAALTSTGASTINIGGNLGSGGTLTSGTGTINFNGAGAQSIGAYTTYNNVTINKSAGTATLLGAATMTGALAVTSGTLGLSTFALTMSGAGTTIDGTGTITGTGALTITAAKSILSTANLTIASPIAISGAVTVTNNGTITSTSATGITGSLAGSTWVNAADSTLNVSGPLLAIGTLTASAAGNTVNYSGAAQTVKSPSTTYANLTLSGSGIKTMPGSALTISEDFTLSGTATATAAAAITVGGNFSIGATNTFANGAFALNVAGDFVQNGTFTAGAGVVTLNGGAAVQTISGIGTLGFANLTVNNTGGITLARNVTVTSAIIGAVTLTNTCPTDYTLTSNGGATVQHSCPLDHLVIQHASGTGLTCAATTLTILACQDAACSAFYTGGISGTLSAVGAPTVNWDGTTGGAAGADFVIASGSSSVTKNVQVATAGTVVFGVSAAAPTPPSATTCNFGAPACTFTASLAGFLFSDTTTGNTYTIPAQVSGIDTSTLYLRAVQASTTNAAVCTPAIIGQTLNVTMGYTCTDPASCQAGNLTTITNTTTSTATAIAPGGTAVSLNFDVNGSAPITVRYDDAGKITIDPSLTVTPFGGATATTLTGSSNAFVVAPHHFTFSGVTAAPIKAGNDFAATVTAYNGLAVPTVTANFGQEVTAESVTLTFTKCQPTGINSVNGAFTGSIGAFAGGAASAANLNWSEVGNGDLEATNSTYLNSTLSPTGNTGTGGTVCNAGGPGNVGRFIPDHFITTITDGCTGSGFSYSGQPFTLAVTAMNGLIIPTTTINYDGTLNTSPNFSKAVTLTAWDAATGLIPDPDGALTNTGILAADFTQGIATINATNVGPATLAPVFTFTSRTTVPASIRIRSVDTDAVTSSGFSEGTTQIRSGRAKLGNAHGSELLALPVPFRAEFWNSGWVLNSADICSGDDSAGGTVSIALTAPVGWAAGVACVQDDGVAPGLSDEGCAAAGPVAQRFTEGGVAGFAGNFNLWLKAPGNGNTGAVTVDGTVPAWLQYPWDGVTASSPSSRATFGVYKGSTEFIYMRENY